MAASDEQSPIGSWVFECVLQFLRSPLWTLPVDGFIDRHCGSFDPSEEEHRLEHTALHAQFRVLVDGLLTDYLSDLGISAERFVAACAAMPPPKEALGESAEDEDEEDEDAIAAEAAALVTEYITACDDYSAFRAAMEFRGAELAVAAMEAHAAFLGAAEIRCVDDNNNMNDATESDNSDDDDDEVLLLQLALRASLGAHDYALAASRRDEAAERRCVARQRALEQRTNVPAAAATPAVIERLTPAAAAPPSVAVRRPLAPLADPQRAAGVAAVFGAASKPVLPVTQTTRAGGCGVPTATMAAAPPAANVAMVSAPRAASAGSGAPTAEAMDERAAYLRAQRDRIVAKKERERREAFDRTQSALAAKSAPVAAVVEANKENAAVVAARKIADAAPDDAEARRARQALMHRFTEDLLLQTRNRPAPAS